MTIKGRLKKEFGLTGKNPAGKEWENFCCPLHSDEAPSAGINWKTKVFNCFKCGAMNLTQLAAALGWIEGESLDVHTEPPIVEQHEYNGDMTVGHALKSFLVSRQISGETYVAIDAYPIIDQGEAHFGYVCFPDTTTVHRKFYDAVSGERYLNSKGKKEFVYGYHRLPDNAQDIILVEGIYDYLAMYELGFRNVCASLASSISEAAAYLFRGKTVFILFDNDFPGYKGALKTSEHLMSVGAVPIILELPKGFGKDPHEAFCYRRGPFHQWLRKNLAKYDAMDRNYIENEFLSNQQGLRFYGTGLGEFDMYLSGGYKQGCHVIGGLPGCGKSSLAIFLANSFVTQGARTLYCSYELSKRQVWARFAALRTGMPWADLEMNPSTCSDPEDLLQLAKKIRVTSNWNINEIIRASGKFDSIIIDYIQRMPGTKPETKQNVSDNISQLSNLARDYGKVIVVISSMPRSAYKDKESVGGYKESGDIEFVAQSAIRMDTNSEFITCYVQKNTRGLTGRFALLANLATCQFSEAKLVDDE